MEHSPELLKSFANQLARVAGQEDATQALRLLRLTGLLDQPAESAPQKPSDHALRHGRKRPSATQEESVGIWTRKKNTTHFARSLETIHQWPFWANVGRIEQKGTRCRVVLIGESVARGYLLDPQFNPAMALESVLQSQMGMNAVEVIDLARTSMGLEIEELAISALLLEPDAAIIFAGNNWLPTYSKADFPYLGSKLLNDGIAGLKQLNEKWLGQSVRATIEAICSAYQARKVPLTWIVPEFNLGDWRDPLVNAPHLRSGDNRQWMQCWKNAQAALKNNQYDLASEFAEKMVALDQETCVAGLYILAECSRERNDLEAARNYLERARDVLIWDPSVKSPRAYSVTQNALREEAAKHHNQIVDLPSLFKQHLKGDLPDSRLFLDYCHLTSEGIEIAMAAAASCVLRLLDKPAAFWWELARHSAKAPAKVKAEGAFLAAVHNAHWHQSYDVALSYCLQALELAPEIAQVMALFLEIQTLRAPLLMCQAAEKLAGMNWPSIQNYLLRFNHQVIDRNLLNAMVDALKEKGIEAGSRLAQLRYQEHSISSTQTNLLDYYYSSAAVQPQEEAWVNPGSAAAEHSHYYRAYSPESRFFFIADALRPVRLSLTCRLPRAGLPNGAAMLAINGNACGEIELGHSWATWDFTLRAQTIQDGLNEISIHWPLPVFPGKLGIEAAAADLLQEIKPEFYCLFGEIHTFTADARSLAEDSSEICAQLADMATEKV